MKGRKPVVKPSAKPLGQPVRKIRKSHGSLTGKLHLPGINKSIAFESSLERDFFILQWFDHLTTDMVEQPVRIPYEMADGKPSSYIPDALVSYRRKLTLLAEVKYSKDLLKNKRVWAPKFEAAKHYAKEQGWVFRIFTEKEIRTNKFQLAWHMLRFARGPCNQEELQRLIGVLRALGRRASFGALLQVAEENGIVRGEAMRLIQQAMARRLVAYDETFPITMGTSLLLKGREGIRLVKGEG